MNIGIPKEISIEEKRIFLAPQGIYSLVKEGHKVYIEKGAGLDGHFYDEDFQKVGAEIVFSHEEAFQRADLVVKVMPPTEEECEMLHEDHVVFSFLQLALRTAKGMQSLIDKKITSIGMELIETKDDKKPVLEVIGEIAGSMLPQIAGRYLEGTHGGRGITICGVPGIPPASIVILGVGNIGFHAVDAFLGLGAQVYVLDTDIQKLRYIDLHTRKRAITAVSNSFNIERALKFADVVISSVYEYGKKTPVIVSREMLSLMKQGALVIDVAIDQGGSLETSRPTTHSDPIYTVDGIIHYCVPNISSAVSRTASRALNNVILPYILQIGEIGLQDVLKTKPDLLKGVFSHDGYCTNKGIANIFSAPFKELKF